MIVTLRPMLCKYLWPFLLKFCRNLLFREHRERFFDKLCRRCLHVESADNGYIAKLELTLYPRREGTGICFSRSTGLQSRKSWRFLSGLKSRAPMDSFAKLQSLIMPMYQLASKQNKAPKSRAASSRKKPRLTRQALSTCRQARPHEMRVA